MNRDSFELSDEAIHRKAWSAKEDLGAGQDGNLCGMFKQSKGFFSTKEG